MKKLNVSTLPNCDFCDALGVRDLGIYDARTHDGRWANMCLEHFQKYGVPQFGIQRVIVDPVISKQGAMQS